MAERRKTERRFAVMGTRAHVLVGSSATEVSPAVDTDALVDQAVIRLEDLERRWSRFVPTSEISQWNRRKDEAFRPSDVTWRLVRAAADASERTGGRFDPTLLEPVRAIGYDRSFASMSDISSSGPATSLALRRHHPSHNPRRNRPEHRPIALDVCTGSVRSPNGFDPGGIGKGFAADLVVDELIADGADRVIVNLGGDLRIGQASAGDAPATEPVDVRIVESLHHSEAGGSIDEIVRLGRGAVATSTTQRRRWHRDGSTKHHIVDPSTNDSAQSPAVLATVVAAEAWWAEAVATALIVDPTFIPTRACALVVFDDGTRRTIGDFDAYRLEPEVVSCSP